MTQQKEAPQTEAQSQEDRELEMFEAELARTKRLKIKQGKAKASAASTADSYTYWQHSKLGRLVQEDRLERGYCPKFAGQPVVPSTAECAEAILSKLNMDPTPFTGRFPQPAVIEACQLADMSGDTLGYEAVARWLTNYCDPTLPLDNRLHELAMLLPLKPSRTGSLDLARRRMIGQSEDMRTNGGLRKSVTETDWLEKTSVGYSSKAVPCELV